jgi:hypothetical protein
METFLGTVSMGENFLVFFSFAGCLKGKYDTAGTFFVPFRTSWTKLRLFFAHTRRLKAKRLPALRWCGAVPLHATGRTFSANRQSA